MIYMCPMCNLGYVESKTAIECETFCKKNNFFSAEIAKKAIWSDS